MVPRPEKTHLKMNNFRFNSSVKLSLFLSVRCGVNTTSLNFYFVLNFLRALWGQYDAIKIPFFIVPYSTDFFSSVIS